MFTINDISRNKFARWMYIASYILTMDIVMNINAVAVVGQTFDIESGFRIQSDFVVGITTESCRNSCVIRCLGTTWCEGINYNSQSGTCETCTNSGSPMSVLSDSGWDVVKPDGQTPLLAGSTSTVPTTTSSAPTTTTTTTAATTTTTSSTAATTTTTSSPASTTTTTAAPTTPTSTTAASSAAPSTIATSASPITSTTGAPILTTQAPAPATTPPDPSDCYDVLSQDSGASSGIEYLWMPTLGGYAIVYCDMVTDGGGWTVLQIRLNNHNAFYEEFSEYEDGFGDYSDGSFWLGLKYQRLMTQDHPNELRVQYTAVSGEIALERYDDFLVGPGPTYQLTLGDLVFSNATGDPEETMKHNDWGKFTTYDYDVDDYDAGNCADIHRAGWWFKNCTSVNPNGEYTSSGTPSTYSNGLGGMIVPGWKGTETMQSTLIMFRRKAS